MDLQNDQLQVECYLRNAYIGRGGELVSAKLAREADVVIEFADNSIAALEIKPGVTVKAGQVRHVRALHEKLGSRFRGGFGGHTMCATDV